jgi:hypothetical protein
MSDQEYVHYRDVNTENAETGLCGLPLPDLLTFDWKAVTCKVCLKHRPAPK